METYGWPLQEASPGPQPWPPPATSLLCTSFKDHDLAPVIFLDFSSLEVSTGSDMTKERPPEGKKELEN